MAIAVSGTEPLVAHCGVVTAQPRRSRYLARLCVMLGACLLLTGAGAAVLFARGLVERSAYTSATACGADPTDDCWVEVSAVVVRKRTMDGLLTADKQVVQVNGFDGLEVALANGARLWSNLHRGDRLTLRLWHGDVVHARAGGRSAETTESPLVREARWYPATTGLLGSGGLLLLAGLGWLDRRRSTTLLRRTVYACTVRAALAAVCVGAAGLVAGLFTGSAPVPVVTATGLAVWVFAELVVRAVSLLTRQAATRRSASSAIPAQRTSGSEARQRAT